MMLFDKVSFKKRMIPVLILFCYLLQHSICTDVLMLSESGHVYKYVNRQVSFTCHKSSNERIKVQWITNTSSTVERILRHYRHTNCAPTISTYTIRKMLDVFNGTEIQCSANTTDGEVIYSEKAILILQGTLAGVEGLNLYIEDYSLFLFWSAPYTLTGSNEVRYIIIIKNLTEPSTIMTDITEATNYTLISSYHRIACYNFHFIIIPENYAGHGENRTLYYENEGISNIDERLILNNTCTLYYDLVLSVTAPICEIQYVQIVNKNFNQTKIFEEDFTNFTILDCTLEKCQYSLNLDLQRRFEYEIAIFLTYQNNSMYLNFSVNPSSELCIPSMEPVLNIGSLSVNNNNEDGVHIEGVMGHYFDENHIVFEVQMKPSVCNIAIMLTDIYSSINISLPLDNLQLINNCSFGSVVTINTRNTVIQMNSIYYATILLKSSGGITISHIISTYDVQGMRIENVNELRLIIEFLENSTASGALLLFRSLENDKFYFIAVDKEEQNHTNITSTESASILTAFDIEKNGELIPGKNRPAILPQKEPFLPCVDLECTKVKPININKCSKVLSIEKSVMLHCHCTGSKKLYRYQVLLLRHNDPHGIVYANSSTCSSMVTIQVEDFGLYHVTVFYVDNKKGMTGFGALYIGNVSVKSSPTSHARRRNLIAIIIGALFGAIVSVAIVLGLIALIVFCITQKNGGDAVVPNQVNVNGNPEVEMLEIADANEGANTEHVEEEESSIPEGNIDAEAKSDERKEDGVHQENKEENLEEHVTDIDATESAL